MAAEPDLSVSVSSIGVSINCSRRDLKSIKLRSLRLGRYALRKGQLKDAVWSRSIHAGIEAPKSADAIRISAEVNLESSGFEIYGDKIVRKELATPDPDMRS